MLPICYFCLRQGHMICRVARLIASLACFINIIGWCWRGIVGGCAGVCFVNNLANRKRCPRRNLDHQLVEPSPSSPHADDDVIRALEQKIPSNDDHGSPCQPVQGVRAVAQWVAYHGEVEKKIDSLFEPRIQKLIPTSHRLMPTSNRLMQVIGQLSN